MDEGTELTHVLASQAERQGRAGQGKVRRTCAALERRLNEHADGVTCPHPASSATASPTRSCPIRALQSGQQRLTGVTGSPHFRVGTGQLDRSRCMRALQAPLIPKLRARVRFPSPAPSKSPRPAARGSFVVQTGSGSADDRVYAGRPIRSSVSFHGGNRVVGAQVLSSVRVLQPRA